MALSRQSLKPQFEALEQRRLLATVTWDGGANTTNWEDAANWDNNLLPTVFDDVVIADLPSAGSTVVQITSVQSMNRLVLAGTDVFASESVQLILNPGSTIGVATSIDVLEADLAVYFSNVFADVVTLDTNGSLLGARSIISAPSIVNDRGNLSWNDPGFGLSGFPLILDGDYTQGPLGNFGVAVDAIANTAGLVQISGAADLAGTLSVTPINNDPLDVSQTLNNVLSYTSVTGGLSLSWTGNQYGSFSLTSPFLAIQDSSGIDIQGNVNVVTSNATSGPGSLHAAIQTANASSDPTLIGFRNVGTINMSGPLPVITAPVEINAAVMGGYSGSPLIDVNGLASGPTANGLRLATGSDGSIVRGLAINRFGGTGLWIDSSNNTIANNYIGTDITGTLDLGNTGIGVFANAGANSNLIVSNLVSGNEDAGLFIASDSNKIQRNRIGTNATGTAAISNRFAGVWLFGHTSNIIGVDGDGVGDATEGNQISGNNTYGIYLQLDPTNTVIAGNLIGLNAAGTAAIPNATGGIYIPSTGNNGTRIGTDADGISDDLERNVISGNSGDGITDFSANTTIAGNYIGTTADGLSALGNSQVGISLSSSGAMVGGTAVASRNVIGGHGTAGVVISTAAATNNTILGNYIGVGADGATAIPNATGVQVQSTATNNTIGGTSVGARNIISGNTSYGIQLDTVSGNFIQGNYIGTNAAGTGLVRNNTTGIYVSNSSNNVIGGTAAGTRNVIAGSSDNIYILGAASTGNRVEGNSIGLDAAGNAALDGSSIYQVRINGGSGNFIGGSAAGAGNWIAGDSIVPGDYAVVLQGANNNRVQGNTIGLRANGTVANGADIGVWVNGGSVGNLIGSDGDGNNDENERNIISGNTVGVQLQDGTTSNNTIAGNYIGTDSAGTTAFGSMQYGIVISTGASNTTIGGFTSSPGTGAGNVIGGYTLEGIRIRDDANNTMIRGNLIGLGSDGSTDLGAGSGISVSSTVVSSATPILIGGDDDDDGTADGNVQARNIISGNAIGINLSNSGTNIGTVIQGNYVGTNRAGTGAVANTTGINVGSAPGTLVGGSTAGAGNLVSGNSTGIGVNGIAGVGSTIQGNWVGTDKTGLLPLSNSTGINLSNANTLIGGFTTLAGAGVGNVISGNTGFGIVVGGATSTGNIIRGNLIGLGSDGSTVVGNGSSGITVSNVAVTIGGDDAVDGTTDGIVQARNIVSGNALGIGFGAGADGTVIAGNIIGLDRTGTLDKGNTGAGIGTGTSTMTIGGTTGGAGNIVSGNDGDGISLSASNSLVAGNTIGLDISGNLDRGNSQRALRISGSGNTIGGTTALSRNIISGTGVSLVSFVGSSNSNVVQGNYIGTDITGTKDRSGTFGGIDMTTSGASNVIGGTAVGAGNVISGANGPNINFFNQNGAQAQGNIIGLGSDGNLLQELNSDQSGISFVGSQNITIGGTAAGARNVISGNTSAGSSGVGIQLQTSHDVLILGNYIGTGINGTEDRGNRTGIIVQSASFNVTIGGTTSSARNLVSGNDQIGISFSSAGSNNIVQGNYIGVDSTGNTVLLNGAEGVFVASTANTTIGGAAVGAGNIISGNASTGITLTNSGTTGNVVQGNYIGLGADGSTQLGNASTGVFITQGASGNSVGGTVMGAGNVISANADGIRVSGSSTSANIVQGNLIGTDATGLLDRGNAGVGVSVVNGDNNEIGGFQSGAGNVISGNDANGIEVLFAGTIGTVIRGNTIGLGLDGSTLLGNSISGIYIEGADGTLIGGDDATDGTTDGLVGARNIISGNFQHGIRVNGDGATRAINNVISGNYIGTDGTGTADRGNSLDGVAFTDRASNNTIGGATAGAGNLISGNSQYGIYFSSANTFSNTIQGNRIGTDINGTTAVGNLGPAAIRLTNSAANNLFRGNLVSGNANEGFIIESDATGNELYGNLIGTNFSGQSSLANAGNGILFSTTASLNIVGGTTPADRNIISGNAGNGILINSTSLTGNTIQGNYIGVNIDGDSDLGNGATGIFQSRGRNQIIGGTVAGAGNVISGNFLAGIEISGVNSRLNTVAGNIIGLNAAGTAAIPNSNQGLVLAAGANSNTIGGTTAFARNVISGNTDIGIVIDAVGSDNNIIIGNYIGTDLLGSTGIPNPAGISIAGGTGNRIGTDGNGVNDAAERNVISGNTAEGIILFSSNNRVSGNYIGTDATGTFAVSNRDAIYIDGFSTGNIIGTDGSNDAFNSAERNIISGNLDRGILLSGANVAAGNWIGINVNGQVLANQFGLQVTDTGARIGTNADGIADADERNVISGNSILGLIIRNPNTTGAVVAGNYIGTDPTGTLARPNASGIGIVFGANNITIGGTTSAARNIISGNDSTGISIDVGSNDNIVQGNYIGTDVTGLVGLGNVGVGVNVTGGSTGTRIGGSSAGAGNVISGSVASNGVAISGLGTDGTTIQGNFIGTDKNGTSAIPNFFPGVAIIDGAANTQVGGLALAPGTGAGNVISGNREHGILVSDTGTSGTLIRGNLIGLAAGGTSTLGNGNNGSFAGIAVFDGASDTTIGGISSLARNVVSGNQNFGIVTLGSVGQSVTNTVIQGNYVGTNITGTAAIPNGRPGIGILDQTATVTIGGSVAGASNLISGNAGGGVFVSDLFGTGAPTGISIQANYIGTNADGTVAVPNTAVVGYTGNGIEIRDAASVVIGGTAALSRNIVSGNAGNGVLISGLNATGNTILGNYIGTDKDGVTAIPNATAVSIESGANNNTVGGVLGGATNVISGNTYGVSINGGNSNTVSGNYVGLASDGLTALGNNEGIRLSGNSNNNTIGGVSLTMDRANYASGNPAYGIVFITSPGTSGNTVVGNIVGLNIAEQPRSNGNAGLIVNGAGDITIGGIVPGSKNVFSGNDDNADGIWLNAATNVTIQGNYIGTDTTGEFDRGNSAGIALTAGSSNNTIGGTTPEARNIISASDIYGIGFDTGANNNLVLGNYIGTDKDGATAIGNHTGVRLYDSAGANTVGGLTAIPGTGAGNVISGNSGYGIEIEADDALVQGNIIGLAADGQSIFGAIATNGGGIFGGGDDAIIGGVDPRARNVISGTGTGFALGAVDGWQILNNYVGVDVTGTQDRSNYGNVFPGPTNLTLGQSGAGNLWVDSAYYGVFGFGSNWNVQGNRFNTTFDGSAALGTGGADFGFLLYGASSNINIGGTVAGQGNQFGTGVNLQGVSGGTVLGNTFGLNAAGNGVLAGTSGGLTLSDSSGIQVGTNTPDGRNVFVTDNPNFNAVDISGAKATNNTIQGNYFGTNATGTALLGELYFAVNVQASATGNTIDSNVIAKADAGILIDGRGTPDFTTAWFRGNGDLENSSGYLVGGTIVGSVGFGAGLASSQALNFSRVTPGYVYSEHIASYTATADNISLQAWVNPASLPGAGGDIFMIAGNGDPSTPNYLFGLIGSPQGTRLYFQHNISTGVASYSSTVIPGLSVNNYRHVAVRGDGATVQFFVDGTLLDSQAVLAPATLVGNQIAGDPAMRLFIGGAPGVPNTFDGNLEDVAVSYPALSPQVIARVASLGGDTLGGSWTRDNAITGNLIGMLSDGVTPGSIVFDGVYVLDSEGNQVRGNTIARAGDNGVHVAGRFAALNHISGNFIGTNSTSTLGLGNVRGIAVIDAGAGNVIGVNGDGIDDANERNLISGNTTYGGISVVTTPGIVIAGNWVGLNAAGDAAIPNTDLGIGSGGISVITDGARIGTNADGISDELERNVIAGNVGYQVRVPGDGNIIAGNYIGTNATGTAGLGSDGVLAIWGRNNRIGTNADANNDDAERNVISSMTFNFVATGNTIAGNFIGTDKTGNNAVINADGLAIANTDAINNLIGGPTAASRNVIANRGFGVTLNSTGNIVQGNYIGVRADGSGAIDLSSVQAGIRVTQASNQILGNTIGGFSTGIYLEGSTANGTIVQGNYVGTNPTGSAAIPNVTGLLISDSANNTIGGTVSTARNVISGNVVGVRLTGAGASNNIVLGNYIGTNGNGSAALANTTGIGIDNGAINNTIGGVTLGARNIISGNVGSGVQVSDAATSGNAITGNWIGVNTLENSIANAIGVRVVANTGPNTISDNQVRYSTTDNLLIESAGILLSRNVSADMGGLPIRLNPSTLSPGAVTITQVVSGTNAVVFGEVNARASTTYTVELFSSPTLGQASRYIASQAVATDASGFGTFMISPPPGQLNGYVHATLTGLKSGETLPNTSELSNGILGTPAIILGLRSQSPEGTPITLSAFASTNPVTGYLWEVRKDGLPYAFELRTDGTQSDGGIQFTPDDEGLYTVSLRVTLDDGSQTLVGPFDINVYNVAPTPSFSYAPSVINVGAVVTLTSNNSDPGQLDILTNAWEVRYGSTTGPVVFSSPPATAKTAVFTPDAGGFYYATMTVDDGDGGLRTLTREILVSGLPASTSIIVPQPTVLEGQTVRARAPESELNRTEQLTFSWSVTKTPASGPIVTYPFTTPSRGVVEFVPDDNGIYTISLTLSDGVTNVVATPQQVVVGNASPLLRIESSTGLLTANVPVNLTSTFTDPGVADTQTVTWTVARDGQSIGGPTLGSSFSFTPTLEGVYVVTATVTDDDGGTSSAERPFALIANPPTIPNIPSVPTIPNVPAVPPIPPVSVAPTIPIVPNIPTIPTPPVPPAPPVIAVDVAISIVAPAGPYLEGVGYSFTAVTPAPVATYSWAARNAIGFQVASSTSPTFSFTPNQGGNYQIELTVTLVDGRKGQSVFTPLSVQGAAPTVQPLAIVSPTSSPIYEGTSVLVTTQAVDPRESIGLNYQWELKKPTESSYTVLNGVDGAPTDFRFVPADEGDYEVRVSVSDSQGLITTRNLIVSIANAAPVARISGQPDPGNANNVLLNAIATDPGSADLLNLRYEWSINGGAYTTLSASNSLSVARSGLTSAKVRVTDGDTGSTVVDYFIIVGGTTTLSTPFVIDTSVQTAAGAADQILYLGTSGNDYVNIIAGVSKKVVVFGGFGNDTLDASAASSGVLLDGGDGDDVLIGSASDDVLIAGPGTNLLLGGNGNNRFVGGGSDTMFGGVNTDYYEVHFSDVVLNDAGGADTIDLTAAQDGVTLNLSNNTGYPQTVFAGSTLALNGLFESLIGSPNNDDLSSSTLGTTIDGGLGDDTLSADATGITLLGGDGNDTVILTNAGGVVEGGKGDDTITGTFAAGSTVQIATGTGDDTVDVQGAEGSPASVSISLGDGTNSLTASDVTGKIYGSNGGSGTSIDAFGSASTNVSTIQVSGATNIDIFGSASTGSTVAVSGGSNVSIFGSGELSLSGVTASDTNRNSITTTVFGSASPTLTTASVSGSTNVDIFGSASSSGPLLTATVSGSSSIDIFGSAASGVSTVTVNSGSTDIGIFGSATPSGSSLNATVSGSSNVDIFGSASTAPSTVTVNGGSTNIDIFGSASTSGGALTTIVNGSSNVDIFGSASTSANAITVAGSSEVSIFGSATPTSGGMTATISSSTNVDIFGSATGGPTTVTATGTSNVDIFGSATPGTTTINVVNSTSTVDIFGSASPTGSNLNATVTASSNVAIFGSASTGTTVVSVDNGSSNIGIFGSASPTGSSLNATVSGSSNVDIFGSASSGTSTVTVNSGSTNIGIFGSASPTSGGVTATISDSNVDIFGSATGGATTVTATGTSNVDIFGSATAGTTTVNVINSSSNVGIFGSASPTGSSLNATVTGSSNVDIFGSASSGTSTVTVNSGSTNIGIFGSASPTSGGVTATISNSNVDIFGSATGGATTVTATGTSNVDIFGSATAGTTTVNVINSSSNVGIFGSASPTGSSLNATVTASSNVDIFGSASGGGTAVTVSGSSNVGIFGSASPNAGNVSVAISSNSSNIDIFGSASGSVTTVAATGSSDISIFGSASPGTTNVQIANGSSNIGIFGSASPTGSSLNATVIGSSNIGIFGSASPSGTAVTVSGSSNVGIFGSASPNAGNMSVTISSNSSNIDIFGSASGNMTTVAATGSSDISIFGSASPGTTNVQVASGSSNIGIFGSASPTGSSLNATVSGSSNIDIFGSASSGTTTVSVANGSSEISIFGSASPTGSRLEVSVNGSTNIGIFGSAAGSDKITVVGGGQVGIYGLASGEASMDGVQRAVVDSSVFGSATSGAVVVKVSGSSDVGIFGSATTGPVLNATVSGSTNVDIFGSASPGSISVLASQNIDIFGSASSGTTISVNGSSDVNIFGGHGDVVTLQGATRTRVEGGVFGAANGPGITVSVGGGSSNVGIFGTSSEDNVQVGTGSYIGMDLRGGNDIIEVDGAEHLVAITDAGEDSVTIQSGFDMLIYLGAGVDRAQVLGGELIRVIGDEGNDEIILYGGTNLTVDGGDGNDKLFITGGSGINIRGDAGDDNVDIYGGIGLSIVGGSGADRLRVFGSLGGTLGVGQVYALLDGQDDNDLLEVRPLLSVTDRGPVAAESVEFPYLYAPLWMTLPAWITAPTATTFASSIALIGGSGSNTIWLEGSQRLYGIGGDVVDTITLQSGSSSEVAGGRGTDIITVRATGTDNRVFGDQDDDTIDAYAGNRLGIFGEEGIDTIRFHDGRDGFARGGDADDVLEILNGTRLVLAGESGNDSLTIAGGTSGVAAGGIGNDTLEITGGSLGLLLGQSGNDHLLATGGAQSIVSGGDGDDRIDAANRGDDLYGDDGDDEYRILTTTSASQLLRLRELLYVDPVDFEPEARGSDTIDLSAFAISAVLNLSTTGVFNSQTLGLQSSIPGQLQIILLGSLENIIGTTASDALTGNSESNRIVGLAGNDTILGLGGDDSIEGGSGDDILDGGIGDDVYFFTTTSGVSIGSDTLYEATDSGVDGLDFSGMPVGLGTLDLALASSQSLSGGLLSLILRQSGANATTADVEEVIGTDFDDILLGNVLDNRIEPKRGNDIVDGRAGSDIYVFAGRDLGSDQVIDAAAGAGRDTLDFVGFDAPVVLDLAMTTSQPLGELTLTLGAIDSIENVLGSSFDDTIRGNARDNTIYGAAGQDWLEGRSGNDKLVADLPSVVLLDFDSAFNAARGDYNYSVAERNLIQQKLTTTYAAFNWSFTQSESEARALSADMGRSFVRIAMGQGRGGGILGDAGEVDFRNIRRRVVTEVNINPLLPTVRQLLEEQVGSTSYTPEQYSDMVVAFTATIAGHELAHTAGLRHGDSFGPIGSGLYAGTDQSNLYPVDTRGANGNETGWHMLSSPASTGTPLADAAKTTFFGEREAIKMAFNEIGRSRRETETVAGSNDVWMLAEPMAPGGALPGLYVPNLTPNSGFARSGQSFDVSAMAIVGDLSETNLIGDSDRDFYSFIAEAGDYVNIELMVSSIRPLRGDPFDGEIRLYDANGIEIGFNDDDFEGTKDATLMDFAIPSSGTYYVAVGLSAQPVFGTGGRYELFVSRFRLGTAANVVGDTLFGGAGNDVIVGGAANDLILGGGSLPGDLDTIDGKGGYDTVDGQGLAYNYTVNGVPIENVIATINTPPSVIIQGPVDGLLNVEQSFTFSAVDLDSADANGPFEFTIMWGDGTQEVVTSPVGQTTITRSKAYTAVSPSGTFVITVTVKDARNLTGPAASQSFAATGWTIMDDPANLGLKMLVVVGSQGADDIRIKERCGDYLKVKIREREDNIRIRGIVSGDVDRILVFGLDGNDRITIDDDIDINAEVWGGKGKDEIKGGGGHDILLGGAGDDKIYGGDGRDFIMGGTGADRLYGDAYDDILVAGFTAFDEEFNASAPSDFAASARLAFHVQRQALEAILAEWTSCRSYTTRRNNILGTGSGTRLNGNYYLKATGSTAASNTVFDDGAKDILWGESGTDWFFANLDGDNQSAKDEVKDKSSSETITDTDRWW